MFSHTISHNVAAPSIGHTGICTTEILQYCVVKSICYDEYMNLEQFIVYFSIKPPIFKEFWDTSLQILFCF